MVSTKRVFLTLLLINVFAVQSFIIEIEEQEIKRSTRSVPSCRGSHGEPISTGPFEKPGDCNNFYQCGAGILYTMPCAPGTAFNPALGVCDWPYNVPGCGGGSSGGSNGGGHGGNKPPCDHQCSDHNGNPTSGPPFEKPGDCEHFYQCGCGILYTMSCAPGTAFNPALGVCDWPYNVPGCGGNCGCSHDRECQDSNGRPISSCPEAIPGDCKHYKQCTAGELVIGECPDDLVFNPDTAACDCPENVVGCGAGDNCTGVERDVCHDSYGRPLSTAPFEKPGDCTHFYQCGAGILYTMPCAPGTAFNPALGVCDWPYNVPGCGNCYSKSKSNNVCLGPNGYPISGDPFEKPGDCTHFYQCAAGILYTMPCAPGTAFNPRIGICDWPYNVPGCGGQDPGCRDQCHDASGRPISTGPFEKPGDCGHFYQCAAGILKTMSCAPGTAFNPALGVCDWPYNVPGCGESHHGPCTLTNGIPRTTGPFAIAGNCTHYQRCNSGNVQELCCPDGTVFNPNTGLCDCPNNVPDCGCDVEEPNYDPECIDCYGNPTCEGPFEKPGDCNLYYQCVNGYLEMMRCKEGESFSSEYECCVDSWRVPGCGCGCDNGNICESPYDDECVGCNGEPIDKAPFDEPSDCCTYYQCCNGKLVEFKCPNGQAFDPDCGHCVPDYLVPGCGCNGGCHAPPDQCHDANGRPLSTEPFEKPGDCDHFYQCGAGILYTMPCAEGTVFNPKLKVCDWPYNVPGCYNPTHCRLNPKCVESDGRPKSTDPFEELGQYFQCGAGILSSVPKCGGNTCDGPCCDKYGQPISTKPFQIQGDCNCFYQCSCGHLRTECCPDGLTFNPVTGTCDFDHTVPGCGCAPNDICHGSNGEPICGDPFPLEDNCTHYQQCVQGELVIRACQPDFAFSPEQGKCVPMWEVPGCYPTCGGHCGCYDPECVDDCGRPLSNITFPIPGDCNDYLQCSCGKLQRMSCQPDHSYNPDTHQCDHSYNVCGCCIPTCDPCHTECGKPISTGPFAKPDSCSYYICTCGELIEKECPKGYAFNPDTLVCVPAHYVEGCYDETCHLPPPDPECVDDCGNPIPSGRYPIKGNCSFYIECCGGYKTVVDCGDGFAYNPITALCDFDYNVDGCCTPSCPGHYDPCCVDECGRPISKEPEAIPGDCKHFKTCCGGKLVISECGDGLAFNPETGYCDHAYNVPGCYECPPHYDACCVDDCGRPISRGPQGTGDCKHYTICCAGKLITESCPEGTAFNPESGLCDNPFNVPGCYVTPNPGCDIDCQDDCGRPISSGPFPIPNNCTHFYQCACGDLVAFSCPNGQAFNPDTNECQCAFEVCGCEYVGKECNHRPDGPCVDKNGKPLSTEPFEKRGDCEHFYQCGAGVLYTLSCPSGLVFNPILKSCDWPYNVPGCCTNTRAVYFFDTMCVDSTGRPKSTDPVKVPNKCDSFQQCAAGTLFTRTCPEGTLFNSDKGFCDWEENVIC